jgi:CTD nuclear envelope phosphatase 1
MNSLNILSARVSPPQTPSPSRSNSYGNILSSAGATESRRSSRGAILNEKDDATSEPLDEDDGNDRLVSEETSLLENVKGGYMDSQSVRWNIIPGISRRILDSLRWVLSTLAAPGVYLIACLYDERGNFAPFSQIHKLGSVFSRGSRRASTTQALGISSVDDGSPLGDHNNGKGATGRRVSARTSRFLSSSSSSSGMSSESESDRYQSISEAHQSGFGTSGRHTRSKSLEIPDEISPARRSIRIKLHNEDSVRQRKPRKSQSTTTQSNGAGAISGGEISPATLKSPTSPAASLLMTKYPRAPAPPRPLIPRRQPSYTLPDIPSGSLTQKTLILDLDETLIHSMAKGGRMSTGHMVEVKLNTFVGTSGSPSIGSQHPILYYVHKRPHCDDFLRRVSESRALREEVLIRV